MRRYMLSGIIGFVLLIAFMAFGGTSLVMAQTSVSPNYKVSEMEFGAGGTLESCSSQYCTRASIGSMVSGESAATRETVDLGPIPSESEPLLEMVVSSGESNLGVLRTDQASYKITTVEVRNYLSSGYTLQVIGDSPSFEGHTLATPSSPTASTPGTEQFAINAVKNTNPDVGADAVQVPSPEFSFGRVESNYSTPDMFMYQNGATIASSSVESGQTRYTISMIINVSNRTPAGHYSSDFSVVAIPVF